MRSVTPDQFPPRFRMAMFEIGRDSVEPQWSAATWLSVGRRSVVLAGIFGLGLLTGQLSTAIFAAFGALQLGLIEASLPRTKLFQLLAVNVVSLSLIALASAVLGGTWWTVLLLGALAFVNGANVASGLLPMITSLGSLTIAVIFAGLPSAAKDPTSAALWFAAGASLQSLGWLLTANAERSRAVRRMLANNIRAVQRLLRGGQVNGWQSHAVSLDSEQAAAALDASGLPLPERARAAEVVRATADLHRSVVAWRILKDPGRPDRLIVDESLRTTVRNLDESLTRPAITSTAPPRFASEEWAVDEALRTSLVAVDTSVARLRHGPAGSDATSTPDADQPSPGHQPPGTSTPDGVWLLTQARATITSLRPSSHYFRNGVRLATAIMVAQAVALLTGLGHSFWIPLTVVFVVKPDWSFTVVRSTSRFLGNLAAVVLIPLLLLAAADAPWAMIAALFAISLVAFRYFTANYIAASFGVAGTILILDQALAPNADLYVWRVAATVIGTVIGLLAAVAIPTWNSRGMTGQLGSLVGDLAAWTRKVFDGLIAPATVEPDELLSEGRSLRSQLLDLVPRSAAALTEPRPRTDPRLVVAAVDSTQRIHLILTALAFHAAQLNSHEHPGLAVDGVGRSATTALEAAAHTLGAARQTPWSAPTEGRGPLTPEDIAVMAQSTHVAQSADDLLAAVQGMTTPTSPRA